VFERFTDRARRVVVLAQEEARILQHSYIGTEHILLGLIHEGDGVAAKVLESLGISLEMVRQQVEEIIGQGQSLPSGHIPFTPRAKKVMELSLREALQLSHNYIGTEHILLGIIREGEGVASQVLQRFEADLNTVRGRVLETLSSSVGAEPGAERRRGEWVETTRPEAVGKPVEHDEPRCPRCRALLAESARWSVIDVPAHEGEGTRAVPFAFCRRCGTWLGTVA
jgi:ATP-dependent Clp protease ATP-binding subunit ClpA